MPSKEGNFDELIMKFHLGIGHNKTTRKKGNPKSNKTRATAFCFLGVGLDPQINAPPLTPHFDNDTKVALHFYSGAMAFWGFQFIAHGAQAPPMGIYGDVLPHCREIKKIPKKE